MNRKLILITNDDGIGADGLRTLVSAAKSFGDIWVIAPDGQRSAASHNATFWGRLVVRECDICIPDVKAFSCSGTPADCVRAGILKILPRKPDHVLAGVNNGYNIAADIQYSGTVGAALEGAFYGVHSIAFSQCGPEYGDVVSKFLPSLIEEYIRRPLGKDQVFNINFPECSANECRGVLHDRVVSKDDFYDDYMEEEIAPDGSRLLKTVMRRIPRPSEGTDLEAVLSNYISAGIVNNIS